MLTFTSKEAKEHNACGTSYRKFAKFKGGIKKWRGDRPFPILEVLESNGLEDALWVLGRCKATDERDRIIRLFSCDCAERVLPIFEKEYPKDKRPRKAIEVSRKFADGKATQEQLDAARAAGEAAGEAAWAAARAAGDAAWAAARAAREAAWAARAAAWAAAGEAAGDAARAAWDAEQKWQTERLRYYLTL